jgi:hypothetical protein
MPNPTELRKLLESLLYEHQEDACSNLDTGNDECRCGKQGSQSWREHFTSVLLSLPGIAIVQLPEPDHTDDRGWQWWAAKGKWDSYDICAQSGGGVVEHRVRSYGTAKARSLAAALLAAAAEADHA